MVWVEVPVSMSRCITWDDDEEYTREQMEQSITNHEASRSSGAGVPSM